MEKMKGYKILVVDDSPELLDITTRALIKAGYLVFSAVNGVECLRILKEKKPELILLVIRLPDINGKDICKKVKSNPEFSSVFILLISSLKTRSEDISEGLEVGADGYIIRPVENRELIARVEAAFRTIKAERELRASNLRWRTTFDSVNDAVFMLDTAGIVIQANKSATKLLKKTEAELLGHHCYENLHCSKCTIEDCPFMKMKESMKRETMLLPVGEKWFEIIVDPLIDDKGDFHGALHFISDITARNKAERTLEERTIELQNELEERKITEKELNKSQKQLEISKLAALNLLEDIKTEMIQRQKAEKLISRRSEELRISEEKFKNVFEYASVGKSMTSLSGNLHANKAFSQMLGYTKKEIKDVNWRELTHPDDIKKNDEITESILRGEKRSARWEKRYLSKTGEVIWVDISTTLQRDVNDQPLYFITTVVDITEKKGSEEKINQLNSELEKRVKERTSQLEEANKELQAFAYSVSHDLKAPLRAINGFSQFIVEDYGSKLDEDGRRLLGLIRSNTQKMDQLITDILSLSRVTRGEHRVSKVDMTKMAISMLNEVVSPETQEKIRVKIGILPEIYADSTFIKLVWINLISNAVKFSSKEKISEINIGGYSENEFNIYYIKDNGVGFDPEYSSKLFGVFQRLHKTTEFEGTGVGLAIVQRIVHRHGGKVWAEGKVGKGATFYFSLPVKNNG